MDHALLNFDRSIEEVQITLQGMIRRINSMSRCLNKNRRHIVSPIVESAVPEPDGSSTQSVKEIIDVDDEMVREQDPLPVASMEFSMLPNGTLISDDESILAVSKEAGIVEDDVSANEEQSGDSISEGASYGRAIYSWDNLLAGDDVSTMYQLNVASRVTNVSLSQIRYSRGQRHKVIDVVASTKDVTASMGCQLAMSIMCRDSDLFFGYRMLEMTEEGSLVLYRTSNKVYQSCPLLAFKGGTVRGSSKEPSTLKICYGSFRGYNVSSVIGEGNPEKVCVDTIAVVDPGHENNTLFQNDNISSAIVGNIDLDSSCVKYPMLDGIAIVSRISDRAVLRYGHAYFAYEDDFVAKVDVPIAWDFCTNKSNNKCLIRTCYGSEIEEWCAGMGYMQHQVVAKLDTSVDLDYKEVGGLLLRVLSCILKYKSHFTVLEIVFGECSAATYFSGECIDADVFSSFHFLTVSNSNDECNMPPIFQFSLKVTGILMAEFAVQRSSACWEHDSYCLYLVRLWKLLLYDWRGGAAHNVWRMQGFPTCQSVADQLYLLHNFYIKTRLSLQYWLYKRMSECWCHYTIRYHWGELGHLVCPVRFYGIFFGLATFQLNVLSGRMILFKPTTLVAPKISFDVSKMLAAANVIVAPVRTDPPSYGLEIIDAATGFYMLTVAATVHAFHKLHRYIPSSFLYFKSLDILEDLSVLVGGTLSAVLSMKTIFCFQLGELSSLNVRHHLNSPIIQFRRRVQVIFMGPYDIQKRMISLITHEQQYDFSWYKTAWVQHISSLATTLQKQGLQVVVVITSSRYVLREVFTTNTTGILIVAFYVKVGRMISVSNFKMEDREGVSTWYGSHFELFTDPQSNGDSIGLSSVYASHEMDTISTVVQILNGSDSDASTTQLTIFTTVGQWDSSNLLTFGAHGSTAHDRYLAVLSSVFSINTCAEYIFWHGFYGSNFGSILLVLLGFYFVQRLLLNTNWMSVKDNSCYLLISRHSTLPGCSLRIFSLGARVKLILEYCVQLFLWLVIHKNKNPKIFAKTESNTIPPNLLAVWYHFLIDPGISWLPCEVLLFLRQFLFLSGSHAQKYFSFTLVTVNQKQLSLIFMVKYIFKMTLYEDSALVILRNRNKMEILTESTVAVDKLESPSLQSATQGWRMGGILSYTFCVVLLLQDLLFSMILADKDPFKGSGLSG